MGGRAIATAMALAALTLTATGTAKPARQACALMPFTAEAVVVDAFDDGDRIGLEYAMRESTTLDCAGSPSHGRTVHIRQHARGIIDADRVAASPDPFRGFTRATLGLGENEAMFRGPLRGSAHCDASTCAVELEVRAHSEGGSVVVLRQTGRFERRTTVAGSIINLDNDGETEVG